MEISDFQFSKRFDDFDSEEFFNRLIVLVIHAYLDILKTKQYVKSEMIRKRENEYRDDLVERMINLQGDFGFNELIINCEVQERIKGVDERGLLDIKIQYRNLKNARIINEFYHTIECKRFGKDLNINDYYKNGILKFINGKYSNNALYAGLICFIEEFKDDWDMDDIVVKFNEKLKEKGLAALINTPNEFYKHVYNLSLDRQFNEHNLNLIHLMFDYSDIYFDN